VAVVGRETTSMEPSTGTNRAFWDDGLDPQFRQL
jgi:hypothetical protein